MQSQQALRRQMESTESLQSVVKTMKILSMTSIRQYREASAALDDYYRTVELGLRAVLRRMPEARRVSEKAERRHLGAVVFGAARGMSGRFNEELVRFFEEEAASTEVEEVASLALGEYAATVFIAALIAILFRRFHCASPTPGRDAGPGGDSWPCTRCAGRSCSS